MEEPPSVLEFCTACAEEMWTVQMRRRIPTEDKSTTCSQCKQPTTFVYIEKIVWHKPMEQ